MSSKSQSGPEPELLQDEAAEAESSSAASSEPEDEDEAASELPLDQVFEILKNERRRTVLHYLEEQGGTVSLGELAEYVAAVENDTTVAKVTSNERKCVYVGLYQCHLPKMDNMDIVDFNQNRGRISLGPNAAQLQEYLESSESTERSWPVYYGALSAGGLGLLTLSHLGASSFGLTPTLVTAAVAFGVLACAFAHVQVDRTDE